MKELTHIFAFPILLTLFLNTLSAQGVYRSEVNTGAEPDTVSIDQYKAEAEQMVAYLEFLMNTIGSPQTSANEKDIIINESFSKVFRDSKVQIEDDLAKNRSTVTNKDVQAYLKDVDFFFKDVSFEFLIESITHEVNEEGQVYFKVSFSRHLKGIALDGDSVNSVQPRFVEINLNANERDLKIVSIYTTKLSEAESLKSWWNDLPMSWKEMLAPEISLGQAFSMADVLAEVDSAKIGDTLEMRQGTMILNQPQIVTFLKQWTSKEELDISKSASIKSLKPISRLTELKKLSISGLEVSDLVPIRNLTQLEQLDISYNPVTDLSPLRYCTNLNKLDASHTAFTDLDGIQRFQKLETLILDHSSVKDLSSLATNVKLKELSIQHTKVDNLEPLAALTRLSILKASHTNIVDLKPLYGLKTLSQLHIESTPIAELGPLAGTTALKWLYCDNSLVGDLAPLGNLTSLKKVYCDNTLVTQQAANKFMKTHPNILVIYESELLTDWWAGLSGDWKGIFSTFVENPKKPSRENLHELANLTTINLDGNKNISSLQPLSIFINLKELRCSSTPVKDLTPIKELMELEVLDCSHTNITSLKPIENLTRLKYLNCSHTSLVSLIPLIGLKDLEELLCDSIQSNDLLPLMNLERLEKVYCDGTGIKDAEVIAFRKFRPKCKVIYKTQALLSWYNTLPKAWKSVLQTHTQLSASPDRDQLHDIVYLEAISIDNNNEISSLLPLSVMIELKYLKFSNTRIGSLLPLAGLASLEVLEANRSPFTDLEPLASLGKLKHLNIENTPVEELDPISSLIQLKEFICSGTQIKDLKALEQIVGLEQLDCSNTNIKKLKSLENMTNLRLLKCFNTKLSEKKVEDFKGLHPQCEVVFY